MSALRERSHKDAIDHLGLLRLSNNPHQAVSDLGGIGLSVSFSLESQARFALKEERLAFLTQNLAPPVFQNVGYPFYVSSGLGRPDCREKAFDLSFQALGLLREFAGRTENQFGGSSHLT